jgi:hypothetical protein
MAIFAQKSLSTILGYLVGNNSGAPGFPQPFI